MSTNIPSSMQSICILIPCFNEAQTIEKVIEDFRTVIPEAAIFVINNNSTDNTPTIASEAGARVLLCKRPGKGAAMRKALQVLEYDYYIIVDGDDTYPAESVIPMLQAAQAGADMVVGDRITEGHYHKENKRPLHNLGNKIVCQSINILFQTQLKDVLSGYRVLSRRFAKTCPILLDGFEVETEMSIHAVDKLFEVVEIPIAYRDRPPGSESKLNTIRDGMNVLRAIIWIYKDSKPLIFFGTIACSFIICAIAFYKLATVAVLLTILGFITGACGLILDTLAKYQRENFAIRLLNSK